MPRRFIAIWCICLAGWPMAAFAQAPWMANGMPAAYQPYAPSPVYTELVPDHALNGRYAGNPSEDLAIRDVVTDAWFRFEYLNWTIQPPENELLGAPMLTQDPRELFPAVDRVTGVRPLEFSFVPDTEGFDLRNLSGFRGTFGIPSRAGTLELSSFVLQQASNDLIIDPRFDPINLILIYPALTLLDNGVPSDTDMILFDESYNAELRSQMFGADASFVMGPHEQNVGFTLQPTIGLKYVYFYEDFSIRGTDLATGTNHVILSKGHNNFVTTTAGLRLETHHEFLTFGFEPKLLLGINRHEDSVYTEEIYEPTEDPNFTGEEDTDFSAGMDLAVYGKIHLNEKVTIFVGYNALFLTDVARPFDMIRYNDAGLTEPPDIVYEPKRETMSIQGITVGGEIYFWD